MIGDGPRDRALWIYWALLDKPKINSHTAVAKTNCMFQCGTEHKMPQPDLMSGRSSASE